MSVEQAKSFMEKVKTDAGAASCKSCGRGRRESRAIRLDIGIPAVSYYPILF